MNTALFTITQPARDIVLALPRGARKPAEIQRPQPVQPVTAFKGGEAVALHSVRTYYLGINGRVSQRKHLVGELLATVRAHTTDQARYLFAQAGVCQERPYIGSSVLCKCGWHHAKGTECRVCANWQRIGQQILAGEAEA